MNNLIIEINDYELTLINGDTAISECGYALITEQEILFGEHAWQQAKTSPLNIYCHYWQRLGYEEVKTTNSKINHFADLAFMQLQRLATDFSKRSDIIFIVPPYYTNEQLSLLLGLAKACQLSVSAVVNNSVAYVATPSISHKKVSSLFLDIELHQVTGTELTCINTTENVNTNETTNSSLTVKQSQVFAKQGVHDLYQSLSVWINQKLITECRFDGFYSASTEQAIYQTIPKLLKLDQAQYDICIADKNIVINVNEIRAKLNNFFQPTLSKIPTAEQYFISQRFANLLQSLTLSPVLDLMVVNQHSLSQSIAKHIDFLSDDNDIKLITKLPLINANNDLITNTSTYTRTNTETLLSNHDALSITHVLIQGIAYPLATAGKRSAQNSYYLSEQTPCLSLEAPNQPAVHLISSGQRWKITMLTNDDTASKNTCDSIYINGFPISSNQALNIGDSLTASIFEQAIQFIHLSDTIKQG